MFYSSQFGQKKPGATQILNIGTTAKSQSQVYLMDFITQSGIGPLRANGEIKFWI